jgi:hypothetical protein
MNEEIPIRFASDAMVGRLARWLRILGHDIYYASKISDETLIDLARSEGRLILTRDTHLLQRKNLPPHLFIQDDRLEDQLRQVIRDLHIKAIGLLTRCLNCNLLLTPISREEAKPWVPPYVYATQTRFRQCPGCRKIYWPGTHVSKIMARLKELEPNP